MKTVFISFFFIFLLFSCFEQKNKDKRFSFVLYSNGYIIDSNNNLYTARTLKKDTTTLLNLSMNQIDSIQSTFIDYKLYELPHHFEVKCSQSFFDGNIKRAVFTYNNAVYSFYGFDCDDYGFFNKNSKNVNRIIDTIEKIVLQKKNISKMPKSDIITL